MTALIAAFWPYILAAGTAAIAIFGAFMRRSGKIAERNANKAKEADSYAKHLKELEDAAAARARVKPAILPDNDVYRRD